MSATLSAAEKKQATIEKRRATRAANQAREIEEQIAFENKSIWNADLPGGARKRTSSTGEDSGPAKKAREADPVESDEEPPAAPAILSKVKAAVKRKHAAPDIDVDSEDEPSVKPVRRIDFNNLPVKGNSSSGRGKKSKATVAAPTKSKVGPAPKPKPAKIVADSLSEDEDTLSEKADSDKSASESDNDSVHAGDLLVERPQVVSGRSRRSHVDSDDSGSRELDDVAPRARKTTKKPSKTPQALFDSDSDEVIATAPKKKSTKASRVPIQINSDSEDSMPEAPKIHRHHDSDIEMAEAIADALVTIPLVPHSHSRASSLSSGHLSVPASEMDSDNDSVPEAVIPKKKAKKVSAARQQQADAEKPEIKPSTANPQKGKNAVTPGAHHPGTEASWDITTRLALPAPNKEIGMTAQHPELQFVLRNSISLVKVFVLFVNAYLPQVTRAGTARPFIIEAAEIRHASHFILERLLADPSFGTILAPIVLDRTNLLRGGMKRCAGNCVLAFYGLVDLDAEKMKTRIEELLQDHRYIFPTDPKTGQLQLDKPFRHGSIRFVLKEEIFSSPSFVSQNIDRFPARDSKKPDECECPDAMVALAATAVYAALVEYRMTGQRQTIAFTEDAYQGTYNNHIATLEQVRENAPRATHKVLHELFKEVGASNKAANAASGSSAALIHLVDLPESD